MRYDGSPTTSAEANRHRSNNNYSNSSFNCSKVNAARKPAGRKAIAAIATVATPRAIVSVVSTHWIQVLRVEEEVERVGLDRLPGGHGGLQEVGLVVVLGGGEAAGHGGEANAACRAVPATLGTLRREESAQITKCVYLVPSKQAHFVRSLHHHTCRPRSALAACRWTAEVVRPKENASTSSSSSRRSHRRPPTYR